MNAPLLALLLAAAPIVKPSSPPVKRPSASATVKPDRALVVAAERAKVALVQKHGEAQRPRVERGVAQVLAAWRAEDGGPAALEVFVGEQFVSDPAQLDLLFARLETAMEQLDGRAIQVYRAMKWTTDVDVGPMIPVDGLLAGYDAAGDVSEKLFRTKVAFAALLNFPLTTLDERLAPGEAWSRRQWAEARLTNRFAQRVPGEVNARIAQAKSDAELYVNDLNLFMHHVLAPDGSRPFPKGMRLLSHWNLRDQIKGEYARPDGLPRQRLIARAMERIVAQEIPRAALNDPRVDWNPVSNEVRPSPAEEIEDGRPPLARVDAAREPDLRYARILANFEAVRQADPFVPIAPTHIARKFDLEREIPEARATAMLVEVLDSPLVPRIAALIRQRLGRDLEPFDLWYDGFRPRSRHPEAELDAMTRKRYPTAEAFQKDIPNILAALGFTPEKARFLADRIAVDPARGSGHALEASMRGDHPHLRTRVGKDGMDYKGFNIAIHELGHNVEQVVSLYEVDHTLLAGVPNTAFTEALAFVFQARDLQVLGLGAADPETKGLLSLNDLWATYEIAGVALVDLGVWKWLYAHPGATPSELRQAVVGIAKDVWNRHYAKVFGVRDVTLLAVYSHMVNELLYLPDYPIGHLIAAQLEEKLGSAPALGAEFERVSSFGRVAPDLWMRHATGAPVSPAALLRAAERALTTPGAAPAAPKGAAAP
jgi:hypothetical protein